MANLGCEEAKGLAGTEAEIRRIFCVYFLNRFQGNHWLRDALKPGEAISKAREGEGNEK